MTSMEPNGAIIPPRHVDGWQHAGRKLAIILSLMIISGATLATLKAIFHPPDTIDFDFGWTCGFQFMMLYFMGESIARLKPWRIVVFVFFLAIWTTSIFFVFDVWL
ncbi:MAG: hypothetical protein IH600_02850 [Bacteroidetes bacterium]|nr:hypothetical protein [Bacteroidota bacterium]